MEEDDASWAKEAVGMVVATLVLAAVGAAAAWAVLVVLDWWGR